MSFKSRDLMVKLSGRGQEGCGEHTKPPHDCGECTHHTQGCGQCTHVTDDDMDCTPTDFQTNTCQGCEEHPHHRKREAFSGTLALLRQQLRETLASPQG